MNVNNLVFFNSKGYQIPLQWAHRLKFKIIGNYYKLKGIGWTADAEGFIDVDEKNSIISTAFTKNGESYLFSYKDIAGVDQNGNKIENDASLQAINNYLLNEIAEVDIDIQFGLTEDYVQTYSFTKDKIKELFDIKLDYRVINKNNASFDEITNNEYVFYIKELKFKDTEFFDSGKYIDGPAYIYPSSQFLAQVDLEPVSTELVSGETLFILEKSIDEKGNISYKRPKSDNQDLKFEFSHNSETKFIKELSEWKNEEMNGQTVNDASFDDSKIYWSDYKAWDIYSEYNGYENNNNFFEDINDEQPLIFSVGFQSEEPGCYQNTMKCYSIDYIADPDHDIQASVIGFITFKSESIGEDERYRTLFTNFGIPDPKYYPTVFKDMDIHEEGIDWKFINKKSKELFLTYDKIFPYVGSYKALINAVKFLGYEDIVFKEWYQHWDGANEDSIAYESVDVSAGQTLRAKLKYAGVSLDEFTQWKKMNRLSLIYKINKDTENYEALDVYYNDYKTEEGKSNNPSGWSGLHSTIFEVPQTQFVYDYYNSVMLAKLYALKDWLNKYILGINCRIIDVTGEGIIYERTEEVGYFVDYTKAETYKEESISPVWVGPEDQQMRDSSAVLSCTLKELQERRTIGDLGQYMMKDMIAQIFDIKENTWVAHALWDSTDYENQSRYCILGNSLENPIKFNEISYTFSLPETSCGTFGKDTSGGLLVMDNELYIYENKDECEFINLPVIRIESGTIRRPYGKWQDNKAYSIELYYNINEDHYKYAIKNTDTENIVFESNDYITLVPSNSASSVKYTNKNKYGVPMFILEGYNTFDKDIDSETSAKFILTIDNGYIQTYDRGDASSFNISRLNFNKYFNNESNNYEQSIYMSYKQETPRTPVWKFDVSNYVYQMNLENSDYISKKEEIENNYKKEFNNLPETIKVLYDNDKIASLIYNEDSDNSWYITNIKHIQNQIKEYNKLMLGASDDSSEFVNSILQVIKESDDKVLVQRYIDARDAYINKINWAVDDFNSRYEYYKQTTYTDRHISDIDAEDIAHYNQINYIKESNFDFGNVQSVKVRHTGDWELYAKGWDAYNAVYSNKATRKTHVWAASPEVFSYVPDYNKEYEYIINDETLFDTEHNLKLRINTDNDILSQFYTQYDLFLSEHNISTVSLFKSIDVKTKEDLISYIKNYCSNQINYIISFIDNTSDPENIYTRLNNNKKPLFMNNYRRNITWQDIDRPQFLYENLSYIFDTPKEGDYIKLDNCTEKVSAISAIEGEYQIRVTMLNENPEHQNLYYKDASVYLMFINNNTKDIYSQSSIYGPYQVSSFIKEKSIKGEADVNSLTLSYSPDSENSKAPDYNWLNESKLSCYAICTSEFELTVDDIKNDYDNKRCTVYIKDKKNYTKLAFDTNQCVKIMFSTLTYEGQTYTGTKVNSDYISGTTYRIIDSYYDYDKFTQVYILDGLINKDLLVPTYYKNNVYNKISDIPEENMINIPYKVKCIMTPDNGTFVSYVIKCSDNAIEQPDKEEGLAFYQNLWFGKDYIDPTFSFTVNNFNTRDAIFDWDYTQSGDFKKTYEPVFSEKGNSIIIDSNDEQNSFGNKYMEIWDVWLNETKTKNNKTLLWEVVNSILPFDLNYKGEYDIELTSIDRYGNRIKNLRQGFIKTDKIING